MTNCESRDIDVFVTEDTAQLDLKHATDKYHDHYCMDVQSVEIVTAVPPWNTRGDRYNAIIRDQETEWIIPTWSHSYADESTYRTQKKVSADGNYGYHGKDSIFTDDSIQRYRNLKVGDIVRFGLPENNTGSTDYVTILERIEVDRVFNGTKKDLPIINDPRYTFSSSTHPHVNNQTGAANTYLKPNPTGQYTGTNVEKYSIDLSNSDGPARIAYRISAKIDCTSVPDNEPLNDTDRYFERGSNNITKVNLQKRNQWHQIGRSHTRLHPGPQYGNEHTPMFVHETHDDSKLTATLAHNIKSVHHIKLVGYSIVGKRQVNITHSHEMPVDDYLILRIKEVDGQVRSNNVNADHSFAVLPLPHTINDAHGAVDVHRFDYDCGIANQPVSIMNLQRLTLEVLDRFGKPAHFGRIHLWFKLHVSHG